MKSRYDDAFARVKRLAKAGVLEHAHAQHQYHAVKRLLDVAGRARLVPQLHRFQVVGDEVVDDGRRDGLLVGEVVVEQRPRHAAALADVLHGRAGKALLFIQLPRRFDDLLPALIAHVCHLPKRLRVPRSLKRFDGFRIRGSLTHRQ